MVAIKRNGMPLNWSGTHIGDEVLKVRVGWAITLGGNFCEVAICGCWACRSMQAGCIPLVLPVRSAVLQ